MSCASGASKCSWSESVLRASIPLLAVLQLWSWSAQAKGADSAAAGPYYSLSDFQRVEKIDAHVHVHGPAVAFMAQAIRDNFRILTINVDYPDFPPVPEQQAGPQQRCSGSMAR
jgi:hypothetical protein